MQNLWRWIIQPFRERYTEFFDKVDQANDLYSGRGNIQKQVRLAALDEEQQIQLLVGVGEETYDGWIPCSYPYLNITNAKEWEIITTYRDADDELQHAKIDRIVAEYVLQYLTETECQQFLSSVRPHLATEGRIRIAVPDGNNPDTSYIQEHDPKDDKGVKSLYTHESITALIQGAGYTYTLLEYYDERGECHQTEWDIEDGVIRRSTQDHAYREPNASGSLIIDCGLPAEATNLTGQSK